MSVLFQRHRLNRFVPSVPSNVAARVAVHPKAPASHAVNPADQFVACQLPEFPHVEGIAIDFTAAGRGCRPCLSALVALAVNRPNVVGTDRDGNELLAVEAALITVRELLDETDPLRVRAEQELIPLVARYAA